MSLSTDLKAWWACDEASGNLLDSHNSHNMTETSGTIDAASGKVSGARDFESADTEYFTIADHADLQAGDVNFEFSCWFRAESFPSNAVIAMKGWDGTTSGSREWVLFYNTSAQRLTFTKAAGSTNTTVTNDASLSTGTWYFVRCGHNASSNIIYLQINDGTVFTTSTSTGVNDGTRDFVIGASPPQSLYWDGLIDNASFWKKCLNTDEATYLYNGGSGRTYSEIISPSPLYWISNSNSNFNSESNWSLASGGAGGAGVPSATCQMRFDANGDGQCRLDVSLTGQSFYSNFDWAGKFDAATDNLNHTMTNVAGGGSTWRLGSGTWTFNGNFLEVSVYEAISTGSKIILAGTNKLFGIAVNTQLYDLEITGSYTGNSGHGNFWGTTHLLKVSGTWTWDSNSYYCYGGNIEVTGTGQIINPSGGLILSPNTYIDNAGSVGYVFYEGAGTSPYTPIRGGGTYGTLELAGGGNSTYTLRFPAGTVLIGTLKLIQYYGTGNDILDLDTNDTNVEITGNVEMHSRWSITRGLGTVTFNGAGAQSVDFNGEALGDVVVDKPSGTMTLAGDMGSRDFFMVDGRLDFAGFTIETDTGGNFTADAGTYIEDTVGGGLLITDGDFVLDGALGNEITWDGVDLDVASGLAAYALVSDSDASAGAQISTTNSTDNGGNVNWDFGTVSYTLTADALSLTLSGQAVSPLAARKLTADYVSLAVSPQAVSTEYGRVLTAEYVQVLVSPQTAALLAARRLVADSVSIVVSPQTAALLAARRLVADAVPVVITAQSTEAQGFTLVADAVMVTLSLQDASLLAHRELVAGAVALVASPQAVSLLGARKLEASAVSVLVSPQIVATRRLYDLIAGHVSLVVSPQAASTVAARRLSASHAQVLLAPQSIDLIGPGDRGRLRFSRLLIGKYLAGTLKTGVGNIAGRLRTNR